MAETTHEIIYDNRVAEKTHLKFSERLKIKAEETRQKLLVAGAVGSVALFGSGVMSGLIHLVSLPSMTIVENAARFGVEAAITASGILLYNLAAKSYTESKQRVKSINNQTNKE